MKSKLINIFLILLSLLIGILICEIYFRLNKSSYPSFGWQNNNILDLKIKDCLKKENQVAVFGDSLIEFYGDHHWNLVQKLNNKNKTRNFCNFGMSSTDIPEYINRFLYASNKINFKKAIFFIYQLTRLQQKI